jgi:hypothetical protein
MGQNFPVVTIAPGNGVQVADIFEPGSVAIPTTSNGNLPKYVYVSAYGPDDSETLMVAPAIGAGDGDASIDFPLPVRTNSSVILNVHGYTFIRYAQEPALASSLHLSVVALEDF